MFARRLFAVACAVLLLPECNGQPSVSAPDAEPRDGYEYIVVGSGAGGGPVAARLARSGKRVLLVEAGSDVGGSTKHDVPAMHALATEDASMAWWFFVSHHADASLDREDSKWTPEGILYPRGSALGGSTAVNAMVTVLPSRSDWNRIATLTGDASFRADAMDTYFDRVREWLSIETPDPSLALGDATITAELGSASQVVGEGARPSTRTTNLLSVLGGDLNAALQSGETTGLFRLPLATKNGRRNGPRELVLDTVAKGYPLTVMTGAFVTRVLFDGTRATGVEIVRGGSVYGASLERREAPPAREEVGASREVIVAGGSFNTPQILMLSGIGDRQQLEAKGLPVVADRRGVGANLQDRIEAAVVSEFSKPLDIVARCNLGAPPESDPCLAEWEKNGRGVYRTPGFLATALLRSSPDVPLADLQVFAVPSDARGYYPGYSKDSAAAKNRFSWLVLKARTKNHDGTVTLRDANPFTRPSISFRSFDENDPENDPDLRAVVHGIRVIRDVSTSAASLLPTDPPREIWPGADKASDADLAAWVRREAWGHHACCTDRMGTPEDPDAVVDSRFRVIGTTGLLVVDASTFPEIPGTFIALPTYMLAEKAAQTILDDLAEASR